MTGPVNGGRFRADGSPRSGPDLRAKSLPELFKQGKYWRQQSGEWVRVKDMHPAHRANAARMLLRDAADYAVKVSTAETTVAFGAPDEVFERALQEDAARTRDPEAWMRSTKLYRRLTKGLPDGMRQFEDPNAAHLPPPSDDLRDVPAAPPDSRDAGACPHGFVGSVGCNPCNTGSAAADVFRRVALPTEHTVTVTSGVWTKVADGVVVIHQEPGVVKLRVMTEQPATAAGLAKLTATAVDPWGTDGAAARAALQTVLTTLDATTDLISKNPMVPTPAGEVRFTVQDVRGMVEHAARQIGVTL